MSLGQTVTREPVAAPAAAPDWRRTAVVYQVYPRSFADSNGDGIGDLPGITTRLPALADLGIDAIWLSPFYASPQADAGYDVSDYRAVDPLFGTLADFDALLYQAHSLGLKVIIDLVPNHSSDEHPWFRAALAAGPGSAERARYAFRDGRGTAGELPPNNWPSVFGGPAWTRTTNPDGTPGQWYLHLFDPKQPDWNWDDPAVREEFLSVLEFWLDRGADGFRVDVAHSLVKASGLPDLNLDEIAEAAAAEGVEALFDHGPMWDQDGVHEVYRSWRALLDRYSPDRVLVAEAWVKPLSRLARYVRPDEMHQAFNFEYLDGPWDGAEIRARIDGSLAANDEVGAPTTWVLSNHDVVRHVSRLGLPDDAPRPNGIRAYGPAARPRARPAPSARRDAAHARSAGVGVRLPGRGAGAARPHDAGRHAAAGPVVLPVRLCRGRSRRLPRPAPLGGRRARARLRAQRGDVAAAAVVVRRTGARSAGGGAGQHPGAVPVGPAPA